MSTPKQRQLIGNLRNKLQMTDEEYRCLLYGSYGVESSKQLTNEEAGQFLNKLIQDGVSAGVWKGNPTTAPKAPEKKQRYEDLGNRPGMASPKQLRMIESIWYSVSRATTPEDRARALRSFLSRFDCSDIRFIDKKTASSVITVLQRMAIAKEKNR
jgi:hypothetical protein